MPYYSPGEGPGNRLLLTPIQIVGASLPIKMRIIIERGDESQDASLLQKDKRRMDEGRREYSLNWKESGQPTLPTLKFYGLWADG